MIVPTIFGHFLPASKSETFSTLSNFFAYVRTQFGITIKSVQCDNGREFNNSQARTFFLSHGVALRMSCPYTSQQNRKAERSIRTINNILRSLLFQASLPPVYWVEALHTATYFVNRLPTKTLAFSTPYTALHSSQPSYAHLRVFGCACYPNMSSTAPHKLTPRSSLCVFLGYSSEHKGYRCLELQSNRIIISRHVIFDESSFPFSDMSTTPMAPSALDFLIDEHDLTTSVPGTRFVHAGTTPSAPHAVHGTVPVHGTVAAPELSQGSPGLGAAAQTATSSASSTPVHPGAAAPVHRVQVVASSTAPMAPSSTAGTATSASSTAPAGAAAPVSSVRATASSTTATGRTAATRLVSITPVDNAHPMRTRGKAGIA